MSTKAGQAHALTCLRSKVLAEPDPRGERGQQVEMSALIQRVALVLFRVTYAGFAAAWPEMEHEEGPFAETMTSVPKYVCVTHADRAQMDREAYRG